MRLKRSRSVEEEEEEILRRTVRRSLKPLHLPALSALLRVIRYAEEGKTPMAVAAEDLEVPYKVEAVFRDAERLRRRDPRARGDLQETDDEDQSRCNRDKGRQAASGKA